MSQFILFRGKHPVSSTMADILFLPHSDNSYYRDKVDYFFQPENEKEFIYFAVPKQTMTFDTLFTDAQKNIHNGMDFGETEVGKLLNTLLDTVEEVILWYGDDFWQDLPLTNDKDVFLREIQAGIEDAFCEAYIRYQK